MRLGGGFASTQAIQLGHQARLAARRVVGVDHPFARDAIEHTDCLSDGGNRGCLVAFDDSDFGATYKGLCGRLVRFVSLPAPLSNANTLKCRFAIRQDGLSFARVRSEAYNREYDARAAHARSYQKMEIDSRRRGSDPRFDGERVATLSSIEGTISGRSGRLSGTTRRSSWAREATNA